MFLRASWLETVSNYVLNWHLKNNEYLSCFRFPCKFFRLSIRDQIYFGCILLQPIYSFQKVRLRQRLISRPNLFGWVSWLDCVNALFRFYILFSHRNKFIMNELKAATSQYRCQSVYFYQIQLLEAIFDRNG